MHQRPPDHRALQSHHMVIHSWMSRKNSEHTSGFENASSTPRHHHDTGPRNTDEHSIPCAWARFAGSRATASTGLGAWARFAGLHTTPAPPPFHGVVPPKKGYGRNAAPEAESRSPVHGLVSPDSAKHVSQPRCMGSFRRNPQHRPGGLGAQARFAGIRNIGPAVPVRGLVSPDPGTSAQRSRCMGSFRRIPEHRPGSPGAWARFAGSCKTACAAPVRGVVPPEKATGRPARPWRPRSWRTTLARKAL